MYRLKLNVNSNCLVIQTVLKKREKHLYKVYYYYGYYSMYVCCWRKISAHDCQSVRRLISLVKFVFILYRLCLPQTYFTSYKVTNFNGTTFRGHSLKFNLITWFLLMQRSESDTLLVSVD